jgi:hypothetical protein
MKNLDITQIESYLRNKMSPEERAQFEAALAADPELRRRTAELRQFAGDVRHISREDIRKRVEAVRDKIKREEAAQERPPGNPPPGWIKSVMLLAFGILLGLVLGRLLFHKELPPAAPLDAAEEPMLPVALDPHEEIARFRIPGPQPEKDIPLTVSYLPSLDNPNQPARMYVLDPGGVGLCIYARKNDGFWRTPITLSQVGSQFSLKIGEDTFLLKDDGEEHPLPESPPGN